MADKKTLPFDAKTAGIILGWLEGSDAHEVIDEEIFDLDLHRVHGDALSINGKGVLFCSSFSEDYSLDKFRRGVIEKFEESKKGNFLSYSKSWLYIPDDRNYRILSIPPQDDNLTDAPLELIVQLQNPKEHSKRGFKPATKESLLDNITGWGLEEKHPIEIMRMVEQVPSVAYLPGRIESPEAVYKKLLSHMQGKGLLPR